MSAFDPQEHGARCTECPLFNLAKPVPPQVAKNPLLVILGEAPGRNEEVEGKPFIGASGYMLNAAAKLFNLNREDNLHVTNTLLCRPPKSFSPQDWRLAIEACRPRLELELNEHQAPIFACGAKALQVTTGKAKITPWVGAVLESAYGPVLPSIHPAAALRKPALIPVFKTFFRRAVMLARGQLESWEWPLTVIEPGDDMEDALDLLASAGLPIGIDVETAGLDPMRSPLLCVGVANKNFTVSVPWGQHMDGLKKVLESKSLKVLHNGQHDLLSLKYNGLDVNGQVFDTLLAHAIVGPQLPHDLGFVAALEFHAPRWKSEFRVETDLKGTEAFSKRDAKELRTYNARDAYMTALLVEPLQTRLTKTHKGWELFSELTKLADLAMRMREYGMKVDRSRFEHHHAELSKLMEQAERDFKQVVGERAELGKAGGSKTLHRLFFNDFGIKPLSFTDEGEPQLDAKMLLNIKLSGNPQAAEVADAVLRFRKAAKVRSTYLDGLPLDENDYLHPVWKPWGTVAGRWSSADPNGQNFPIVMRDLVVPRR